jgi:hypothetical protein
VKRGNMAALWTRLRRSELFQPIVAIGIGLVIIGLFEILKPLIAESPWYVQGPAVSLWATAYLLVILMASLIPLALLLNRLLGDQKFKNRTHKAKEKTADSLMSMGTAIQSATVIGLLVVPFTTYIQVIVSGLDPVAALVSWWQRSGRDWMGPPWGPWGRTILLLVLFLTPLAWARMAQRRALDIYDVLPPPSSPPPAPAGNPTTQGTSERPTFPEAEPMVYVRRHDGTRPHRRRRAK